MLRDRTIHSPSPAFLVQRKKRQELPPGVQRSWLRGQDLNLRPLGYENCNWSSLLSGWDYLHTTVRLSIPQEEIALGVPAYRAPEDVTIGRILLMPLRRQREDKIGPRGPQIDRSHPGDNSELAGQHLLS
jgi:hypothetical protein